MGQEDGPAGNVSQLWVYVGTKQQERTAGRQGRPDQRRRSRHRCGRSGGLHRCPVAATYGKGVAAPVRIVDNDWNQTGAAQNADALADGLSLNRIEDGHWDPEPPE